MKDRSKGGTFFSSPHQKLSNVCQISIVRQSIRISLPIFCTRASSKNFYKIVKSSNRPLETGQYSNHYLPRQNVANGEDVTRNTHGERHIDFSITTFGLCYQPPKASPSPWETNRVFGLSNRYMEMNLALPEKKHVSQQCQEIFTQPKTSENLGNGRNFKQCSQTYLHVQETRFNCRLRIGLEQVGCRQQIDPDWSSLCAF